MLQDTLTAAQCLPRRKFKDATEFKRYVQGEGTIIFMGWSKGGNDPMKTRCNAITIPGKKVHTIKALTMITPTKSILYVSECRVDKTQDYGRFQHEFPPGPAWFTKLRIRLDLGFVGFAIKLFNAGRLKHFMTKHAIWPNCAKRNLR